MTTHNFELPGEDSERDLPLELPRYEVYDQEALLLKSTTDFIEIVHTLCRETPSFYPGRDYATRTLDFISSEINNPPLILSARFTVADTHTYNDPNRAVAIARNISIGKIGIPIIGSKTFRESMFIDQDGRAKIQTIIEPFIRSNKANEKEVRLASRDEVEDVISKILELVTYDAETNGVIGNRPD